VAGRRWAKAAPQPRRKGCSRFNGAPREHHGASSSAAAVPAGAARCELLGGGGGVGEGGAGVSSCPSRQPREMRPGRPRGFSTSGWGAESGLAEPRRRRQPPRQGSRGQLALGKRRRGPPGAQQPPASPHRGPPFAVPTFLGCRVRRWTSSEVLGTRGWRRGQRCGGWGRLDRAPKLCAAPGNPHSAAHSLRDRGTAVLSARPRSTPRSLPPRPGRGPGLFSGGVPPSRLPSARCGRPPPLQLCRSCSRPVSPTCDRAAASAAASAWCGGVRGGAGAAAAGPGGPPCAWGGQEPGVGDGGPTSRPGSGQHPETRGGVPVPLLPHRAAEGSQPAGRAPNPCARRSGASPAPISPRPPTGLGATHGPGTGTLRGRSQDKQWKWPSCLGGQRAGDELWEGDAALPARRPAARGQQQGAGRWAERR